MEVKSHQLRSFTGQSSVLYGDVSYCSLHPAVPQGGDVTSHLYDTAAFRNLLCVTAGCREYFCHYMIHYTIL